MAGGASGAWKTKHHSHSIKHVLFFRHFLKPVSYMNSMVTIITTHYEHPKIPSGYSSIVSFPSPPTLETIQKCIDDAQESSVSSMYTNVIRILGHPLGPFLLDKIYISQHAPFEKKTDSQDEHVVHLEVTWVARQNTYPAQNLGYNMTVNNGNINADRMMLPSDFLQDILLPSETISNDQHYVNPNNGMDENQLLPSDVFLHDVDPYLRSGLNLEPPIPSIEDSLQKEFSDWQYQEISVFNTTGSFLDTNYENPISDLIEQGPSSSNSGASQSTMKKRQTKKVSKTNNSLEPCTKKRKQSIEPIVVPKQVCLSTAQFDSEPDVITENYQDYNESMIPTISHLCSDKMLRFERNINKFNKVEYPSNRDPVAKKSYKPDGDARIITVNKGRLIVPIQADKAGVQHIEERVLPLVKLPNSFMNYIAPNLSVIMGVNVVKEYAINELEVGFYRVGNRWFLKEANTEQEKQVAQDHVPLKMDNRKNDVFELETFVIQKPNQLDKVVGPALFKINRSAARGVDVRFKFGDGINLPRLLIYLFKKNNETGVYQPDWETLCLSDYFHQHLKQGNTTEE